MRAAADERSVVALLREGARLLRTAAVESPRLEAEVLLRTALGLPERSHLYLAPGEPVARDAERRYFEMLRRRVSGEPLAYVVGEKEFFSLSFLVGDAVLIPRPATEHVVEAAVEWCRRRRWSGPATALDVGTGSGCVAVALAAGEPRLRVTAVDVSGEALRVAKENVRRHRLASRVRLIRCDLVSAVDPRRRFDLIVSNPPYVTSAEYERLPSEVRREPRAALLAGDDGLLFYRRIFREALPLLAPDGLLVLELNPNTAEAVSVAARKAGLACEIRKDYSGADRVLLARRGVAGR